MSNAFRLPDGTLDRKYLRVCAAYRLTRIRRLTKAECLALTNRKIRKTFTQPDWLKSTVEIWFSGPFKGNDNA
jgi:hypothetical protein